MSKTDEARLRGRAHVGYTRTFEKLEQWFRDIDDELVVGKLPGDLLTPEGETGILGHFELWRPGSTSYLANKFGHFLKLQAPIMMERLRTRGSWDSEGTALQFIVANVTNRGIKDVDFSKTEGDLLDALAAENDYSDEDEVFNNERMVELVETKEEPIDPTETKKEPHEYVEEESQDGQQESDRKVLLVDEDEIPARTVKNEYFECDTSCQGKIRAVKKEDLLTEAGIKAHNTGRYLSNKIKLNDMIRKELAQQEAEVSAMSEGGEVEPRVKMENDYDSEPRSMNLGTAENVSKLPEFKDETGPKRKRSRSSSSDDSEAEVERDHTKKKWKITLSDEQLDILMRNTEFKDKVQRRLRRRSAVKRLQRSGKKLRRLSRKSRKTSSSSSTDSEDEAAKKKTMPLTKPNNNPDGAGDNNPDVLNDIDKLLADSDEEGPSQDWKTRAKVLDERALKRVSRRFSEELEALSGEQKCVKLFGVNFYMFQLIQGGRMTRVPRQERWQWTLGSRRGENFENLHKCKGFISDIQEDLGADEDAKEASDTAKTYRVLHLFNLNLMILYLLCQYYTSALLITLRMWGITGVSPGLAMGSPVDFISHMS